MESHYLPDGRQWAWNSSSSDPAKTCPRKYYYKVRLGLQTKGENVNIRFGGHYAKALERYHRERANGFDHAEATRYTIAMVLQDTWDYDDEHDEVGHPWNSGDTKKNRDTLIRSVVWYLEHFRDDACKTALLADGTPAVELPFRFQVADDIWLTGHLDRVIDYAGDRYVQDQKTTGRSLGAYYFKQFNPHNQMSLYTIAADVVFHTPVKGVMIDAAQIAVGFTHFERGFTFRTPEQSAEWLNDTIYHIKEIWRCEERGIEEASYPMRDTSCGMYGGCEFREVCSKSPAVRKEFLKTGFVESFRSPLEV